MTKFCPRCCWMPPKHNEVPNCCSCNNSDTFKLRPFKFLLAYHSVEWVHGIETGCKLMPLHATRNSNILILFSTFIQSKRSKKYKKTLIVQEHLQNHISVENLLYIDISLELLSVSHQAIKNNCATKNRHWKLGQQAPFVGTILLAYLETTA